MQLIPTALQRLNILPRMKALMPATAECWLVGGALRDERLGREAHDFDFALNIDPEPFVRLLARELNGTYVDLDPLRKQSRIVVKRDDNPYTLDFSLLRAATLDADLALRDFTCNAMACNVRNPEVLIDPLSGYKDLLHGLLRPCSEGVLGHDPLRMLKGVRHTLELNLLPTNSFDEQCHRYHARLRDVAPERIKAELGKIYTHPHVSRGVQKLQAYRLLAPLLCDGEDRPVMLNPLAACQVVAAEGRFQPMAAGMLKRCVEEEWPLYALVRLYASLQNGKKGRGLLDMLRFSRRARAVFRQLEVLDGSLIIPSGAASSRVRALWVDGLGREPVASLLYLASLPAYAKLCFMDFYSAWFQHQVEGRVPDLISATELVRDYGITPGERLGRGLEAIRRDEICGRISTSFDAAEIVDQYFKKD